MMLYDLFRRLTVLIFSLKKIIYNYLIKFSTYIIPKKRGIKSKLPLNGQKDEQNHLKIIRPNTALKDKAIASLIIK